MAGSDNMTLARRLVLALLDGNPRPGNEDIKKAVRNVAALPMLRSNGDGREIDQDRLIREVEAACNVWVPTATTLEDARDHIEWLARRKGEITWNFWERYRRYLLEVKQYAPETVRRLDEVTDEVLKRLEDPARPGRWDR